MEKETDCTALSLLQQIKTESHYREADKTPTIQYRQCMTKTGNMVYVDCRIYIISEWNNWAVLSEESPLIDTMRDSEW